MSFYELERPTPGLADRIAAVFAPARAAIGSMLDSIAYARMMRVLYDMDDKTLARIGITRAEIPAHVDKCLSHGK